MSRKRIKNKQNIHEPGYFHDDTIFIAREKKKARDLRHTAWWRKKISPGKCYYCGRQFNITDLTMDHVIPLARGGTSERINLVPACRECNAQKKYLLPVEWEEYLNSIKNNDQ